ncbi:MAG: dTMP kinase [Desulfuromonas sp.]|nr:MAG: dTMP kinase [Desulfuromonas sp.]
MSFFITFEGIEGSGKTTQIELARQWLENEFERPIVVTREPGGCPIADQIRSTLLDSANKDMDERTELLLYAAARAQHMAERIQPALAEGKPVLCDRFTDATLAYQGYGRGLSIELIEELNHLATRGVAPDLTILLDFPPESGIKRARQRNADTTGPDEDRFEKEALAFHHRVRIGYLALEHKFPRIRKVEADGPVEEVAARIRIVLQSFLEDMKTV